jgi:hypothetical protein
MLELQIHQKVKATIMDTYDLWDLNWISEMGVHFQLQNLKNS